MLGYYSIYRQDNCGHHTLANRLPAPDAGTAVERYLREHPEEERPNDLIATPYPDPETLAACKRIAWDAITSEHARGLAAAGDLETLAAYVAGSLAMASTFQPPMTRV